MRHGFAATILILILGHWWASQSRGAQTGATTIQPANNELRIVHGPIVESLTDSTAIIAWSTNVNAGTVLHYGSDPDHLEQTSGMPWGGLTHRVELHRLQPGTKYFFRAESPHGQGTGEDVQSDILSFQTKPTGEKE
jgi:hypothetical protein